MSRTRIIAAIVAGIVAIGGWYAFRPERLFIDQTVSEKLPDAGAARGQMMPAAAETRAAETGATAPAGPAMSASTAPVALEAGQFHSNAHPTRGTATVFRLADGRQVLRLTDFETSNGPAVHIYLVAAPDVTDDATVAKAGFIELGALKGNKGDQNYDLPANVDLARYRTATIWCARFHVNFGSAPLHAVEAHRGGEQSETRPLASAN